MRHLIGVALALLVLWTVPHRWAGRDADRWYEGDLERQEALAAGVAHWIDGELSHDSFSTQSRRFDGEWLFGTHVMAGLGFAQLAQRDPAWADEATRALARLDEPDLAAFDRESWPTGWRETDRGHVAYLGYANLALALRATVVPDDDGDPLLALHDAMSRALEVRFAEDLIVETYPGERYPMDNAAGIASLAVRARHRGEARPAVVERWLAALPRWRDPDTGLLVQALNADGSALDAPRGSGTAFAAYVLSFADEDVGRSLYESLETHLADSVLGFGATREYVGEGDGDIDSGPLIAGFSISATGFGLASTRRFGSRDRFEAMWATTALFGAPRQRGERLHFATGGPLGDAILFAMLTAPRDPLEVGS